MASSEATTLRQPEKIPSRPKMIQAIEHLDAAYAHVNQSMGVLSSMIMDLEKAAHFLASYRDSLIKTIEEAGGDVTASIESQIREFIPKQHRNDNAGADRES